MQMLVFSFQFVLSNEGQYDITEGQKTQVRDELFQLPPGVWPLWFDRKGRQEEVERDENQPFVNECSNGVWKG